ALGEFPGSAGMGGEAAPGEDPGNSRFFPGIFGPEKEIRDWEKEHSENSLDQQEWEEKLLQFFRRSLSSIPDKSWIFPLPPEIFRQLRDSEASRSEKIFLYKSLGTALGSCPGKDLVRKQLQEILENARYQEEEEREGLAFCFGICARNHLEETLEKLEEFVRSDVFKKSPGLFSIFKERSEGELEKLRSGLVLCYGRVAEAAPPELLHSRLESQILKNLLENGHTKGKTGLGSREIRDRDPGKNGIGIQGNQGSGSREKRNSMEFLTKILEILAKILEFLAILTKILEFQENIH
ncbi:maestro heat-like repeat-containing protein family member 1, partial [Cyanistes caeruleus]|uniref:maestro heat-like repeat-containing protein family member 1 n=1 Tax=Cyanistes caeruleus TaxID=156563 RepID=UPI000CDAE99F